MGSFNLVIYISGLNSPQKIVIVKHSNASIPTHRDIIMKNTSKYVVFSIIQEKKPRILVSYILYLYRKIHQYPLPGLQ